MDKVAFVFAGQGAQAPGMGKDLYENIASVRPVFDRAEALRPGTLKQCFEGPAEELTQTINAQPCLFLTDYACALAVREIAGRPAFCAGFSLGEVVAAAFSGLISFEEAFRLVMKRAELMQACAERHPGAMFAVVKLSAEKVEVLCRSLPEAYPVNYNCPGQTVVACASETAEALMAAARADGGRAIKLAVSGAFHSPFMWEATEGMRGALAGVSFQSPEVPLYANLTARPYAVGAEAETLARQISSPVRWQETVERMISDGAGLFVEVGPGNTLAGLIQKIAPGAQVLSVGGLTGLDSLRGRYQ
jgi:[acyl-carrier-protein] S-malonyltransferase